MAVFKVSLDEQDPADWDDDLIFGCVDQHVFSDELKPKYGLLLEKVKKDGVQGLIPGVSEYSIFLGLIMCLDTFFGSRATPHNTQQVLNMMRILF